MRKNLLAALASALLFIPAAHACDPCSLYSATETRGLQSGSVRISVSEQYTSYDSASSTEARSVRDGEVIKGFSTTQFALAYDISERWGVQATVPIVGRRFDKIRRYRRSEESETGLGDVSLLALYAPVAEREGDSALLWHLFGGVKFPTGDTGSIADSLGSAPEQADHSKHHPVSGAQGGRVLALGTGSYDFPLGTSLFVRRDRFFFLTAVQHTLRTEGDFDYRFSNDTLWDIGPGVFAELGEDHSLAIRLVVSGEHKDRDKQAGVSVEGSEVSNLYLGPELLFTGENRLSGEIGLDLPVATDGSNSTVIPDWKLRAALSYRF